MMNEVAEAIRKNSLVHNPLFNAYFFPCGAFISSGVIRSRRTSC
jgi:hypothetical protein